MAAKVNYSIIPNCHVSSLEAKSSLKWLPKKPQGQNLTAKSNNLDWCKSLYQFILVAGVHVLLGLGSLVEAIWIYINTLTTTHLA